VFDHGIVLGRYAFDWGGGGAPPEEF
jgi:hypothetical protein